VAGAYWVRIFRRSAALAPLSASDVLLRIVGPMSMIPPGTSSLLADLRERQALLLQRRDQLAAAKADLEKATKLQNDAEAKVDAVLSDPSVHAAEVAAALSSWSAPGPRAGRAQAKINELEPAVRNLEIEVATLIKAIKANA
jgi:hypothetical protein